MKKFLPLLILAFALLVGCSEKDEAPALYLDATPALLEFASTMETKTISVSSNVSWVVNSSEPGWCMVLKSQGANNEKVDIRVPAYTVNGTRNATITISSSEDVKPIVINVTQVGVEVPKDNRQTDSLALVAFHKAAKPHLAWDFHKNMNTWTGVHLNSAGRVDSLIIGYKIAQIPFYDGGTLSSELGSLTKLVKLLLLTDGLTGSIPKELGNLKNLKFLVLASANAGYGEGGLTGTIPDELGNLSTLELLYLQDLKLTGGIPAAIGNMSNLQTLVLQGNKLLNGTIPSSIGNLSNLIDLVLNSNALTGTLPKEIGQLAKLQYLWVHQNRLTGDIPNEISNLKKLMELFIHENKFTALPADFTNLTNLELVYANGNELTGTLPNTMNKLTKLTYITLNDNKFSGNIPSTFGPLSNLVMLSLYNNQFSGTIPSSFGASSSSLTYLLLDSNLLTGSIPTSIGACLRLKYFQVQNNSLSGNIPATLLTKFGTQKANFCPQNGAGFDNYDCSGIGGNSESFSMPKKSGNRTLRYYPTVQ